MMSGSTKGVEEEIGHVSLIMHCGARNTRSEFLTVKGTSPPGFSCAEDGYAIDAARMYEIIFMVREEL